MRASRCGMWTSGKGFLGGTVERFGFSPAAAAGELEDTPAGDVAEDDELDTNECNLARWGGSAGMTKPSAV